MLNHHTKYVALFLASLLTHVAYAKVDSKSLTHFANEKATVFETMDGIKTDAFSGFISVPENRANPDSRMIQVHYVRFAATGNKHGSPIVYLSGGPGGSGINTAKYPNFRFPLFMALREHGDVIALDQRGTGLSKDTPRCKSSQFMLMTERQSEANIILQYQLAAKECVGFWSRQGIDILGYNTAESAKDLDALREHFQADKLSLWGISYGSHLEFSAIKQFPSKIDKVVIASAEGLNQTVKLPFETDRYFDRLQAAINTQAEAAKQYPDIKKLMFRVHKQLEEQPLKVMLENKDGTKQAFLFQRHHLQGLASGMIADPQRFVGYLLKLYKSLDNG
jgi:pimeloyl-ACP methyl ester carboxylesterase